MNPLSELTPKQAEAVETLVELHREAWLDSPDGRAAYLAVALLLAQRDVLDYLVAALLKQAEAINSRRRNRFCFGIWRLRLRMR
jgi:hypothetical protein